MSASTSMPTIFWAWWRACGCRPTMQTGYNSNVDSETSHKIEENSENTFIAQTSDLIRRKSQLLPQHLLRMQSQRWGCDAVGGRGVG